jgi:carboxyl-terminal processing protease
MRRKKAAATVLCLTALVTFFAPAARSQQMSKDDRDFVLGMLENVSKDIRKYYYDPQLHGVDWEAEVAAAKGKIKNATSPSMALAQITAVLDTLNDSHTFFIPPRRTNRHDYGFRTAMIGDRCYVTQVRPGSDAEAKGVKPGDEVEVIEGLLPSRDLLPKLDYQLNALGPLSALRLGLRDPNGQGRVVTVAAKIIELNQVGNFSADVRNKIQALDYQKHLARIRSASLGDELLVAKLPHFFYPEQEVSGLIDEARKHQALIIDLRGNPGGAIETVKYLLGGIFEKDVKIGDRKGRKELKPEIAKSRGSKSFAGKLVVLVDSQSRSAAEIFARVVQLEKRGIVIGDRSAGSVMEAKFFTYKMGAQIVVFYAASITQSDLIMTDGKSLEHNGVTPDELNLPSAADLAAGRDPVLAYAAQRLGAKLTPEDAGKMFPYEWPKE